MATETVTENDGGAAAGVGAGPSVRTAGAAYVEDTLAGFAGGADWPEGAWEPGRIADAVDSGALAACPRCLFLNPSPGPCGVCASVPEAARALPLFDWPGGGPAGAAGALTAARGERAQNLADLARETYAAAQALCWAEVEDALGGLRARAGASDLAG